MNLELHYEELFHYAQTLTRKESILLPDDLINEAYLKTVGKSVTLVEFKNVMHEYANSERRATYRNREYVDSILYIPKEADYVRDLPGEIWRPIEGTRHEYYVSNFARIKRMLSGGSDKLLKPYTDPEGYCHTKLPFEDSFKTRFVHRLVATAFLANPDDKLEVNHIDEDKHNNVLSNLEWVTHAENMEKYFQKHPNENPFDSKLWHANYYEEHKTDEEFRAMRNRHTKKYYIETGGARQKEYMQREKENLSDNYIKGLLRGLGIRTSEITEQMIADKRQKILCGK